MLSKPVVKKESVTATHLKAILYIYENPTNSHKNLRLLAVCFTAYAGFLRYDELSNLRISDLKFYDDLLKSSLKKAKPIFKDKGSGFTLLKRLNVLVQWLYCRIM